MFDIYTSRCIFYNIVHDCSAVFDHTVHAGATILYQNVVACTTLSFLPTRIVSYALATSNSFPLKKRFGRRSFGPSSLPENIWRSLARVNPAASSQPARDNGALARAAGGAQGGGRSGRLTPGNLGLTT